MIQEVIYKQRDNAIWLGLRVDRELIDLAKITKVELLINDQTYSSADHGGSTQDGVFDWTQGEGQGVLILRLGMLGVAEGFYNVVLVVYSPDNPNGVIWDTMRFRFVDK